MSISVLRRACQTRYARPDIRITDHRGTQGTWDGSPGPVATIPIDWACTGNNRAIVAVTPDSRRFRFGAITSILSSIFSDIDGYPRHQLLAGRDSSVGLGGF